MMLQQTQTARVAERFGPWLSEFPTVRALAEAPLSRVLERWVGLGYNRRAKFLHDACKAVLSDFGGEIPRKAEQLALLPGIGPYTSSAVSTFAFNEPNVFIETNIRSVYLIFYFPGQEGVQDRDILPHIARTLDLDNPRAWYYALMDYGAELKKKVANPNRLSRHYAKQSKFEGSLREARGAIIRYLGKARGASLEEIAENEGIDYGRVEKASERLAKEGLIKREGSHCTFT
jgi:A/G-specific adenine glycosylase